MGGGEESGGLGEGVPRSRTGWGYSHYFQFAEPATGYGVVKEVSVRWKSGPARRARKCVKEGV